jgi:hypothetical protein
MGSLSVPVMRYLSTLVDRARVAAGMGTTYAGRRDIYETLGYAAAITPAMYRWRYNRGGIAGRIIDAYPDDTWRGPGEVYETQDPEIMTPFETAWEELEARLSVWEKFKAADILAGLGRYSVLVVGAEGRPEEPMPALRGQEGVLYLMPYSEENATFSDVDLEADTASPRFGLPRFYQIKAQAGSRTVTSKVHHTRVIHIVDGALDSRLYAQPRLERVWNYLDDLDKVAGGGAEAFWMRANRGTVFNIDKDVKIEQAELDLMEEHVDEFESKLRRILLTKGVTPHDLGSAVADYGSAVNATMSLVSGSISIPQRILLGSERGELASTQDATAWEARVKARRQGFARTAVVAPFVNLLIEMGGLPPPVEPWYIQWPDLTEQTEDEKLTQAEKAAGLNSKAGSVVVLPDEIRDKYLGLEPLPEGVDQGEGEEEDPEADDTEDEDEPTA